MSAQNLNKTETRPHANDASAGFLLHPLFGLKKEKEMDDSIPSGDPRQKEKHTT